MANKDTYDVIIIGGGAAGLSAAIYAVRYNLNTSVISTDYGGQILETGDIENYPGFKSISGPKLSQKYREHAKSLGAKLITERVKDIKILDNKSKRLFEIKTDDKKYTARSLIITAGAKHRKLDIPGEKELAGRGISYCATCDGPFFKDKTAAVVGGGDAAVTGAIDVVSHAKKVYLIHRRDNFKAKPGYMDQAKSNAKIEFVLNTNVIKAKGDKVLESIVLDKPYKGKKELKVDGLFTEIGFLPETKLSKKLGIELDKQGYIRVGKDQSTNIKGVFAAGDITNASNRFAQLTTAVSEGSIAAKGAYRYLQGIS